ncbi:suppressor of fused domain protein [Sorangium sp. So ce1014]|uniref:suppressor of fused domain protein n=1 Tax=Sorangium sp. So ce1014 TaxID=3133326 RepID=UPI003F5F46BF
MAQGWVGELAGVQVCLFEEHPTTGTVTYATLGLSRHILEMPRGREVRQELLFSVSRRFADDDLAKFLAYVAEGLVREHRAFLRGQVLPLGHAVARGSRCTSLYVALPVVFPDELATCADTQPPTVFAWLIPVHAAEAELVTRLGWNEFEDRLERTDPDLFDLERPPVV